MLVIHSALQKRSFALNLAHKLFVIELVEWIPCHLLWTIGEYAVEFVLVVLANVLALFLLTSDLEQFLDELRLADFQLANAYLSTNLQKLHDVRCISLNRFDPHVVVHSLFHERGIGECFAFL